jgi:hypothetical protein
LITEYVRIEGLTRQEASKPSFNVNFPVLDADSSIDDDDLRHSVALHPFKNIEIASVMVSLRRDYSSRLMIPNDKISVRSNGDASFSRIQIEDLSGVRSKNRRKKVSLTM